MIEPTVCLSTVISRNHGSESGNEHNIPLCSFFFFPLSLSTCYGCCSYMIQNSIGICMHVVPGVQVSRWSEPGLCQPSLEHGLYERSLLA